jgi:hypothetical protein
MTTVNRAESMRRRRSRRDGKKLPVRSLRILSCTSPAVVDNSRGRWPLRWVVRPELRSWGGGPDDGGGFGFDELLEDPLQGSADGVGHLPGAQRLEELGQVRLSGGHRRGLLSYPG